MCLFLILGIRVMKRLQRQLAVYSSLWRDIVRICSIFITFQQINSSLPAVIDIRWPQSWISVVDQFAFVNIDVMTLVAGQCVGGVMSFYLSFGIMLCLPLSILFVGLLHFRLSLSSMVHKFAAMPAAERQVKTGQALHHLFHMADKDHSGQVDPRELMDILKSLGWKLRAREATGETLARSIAQSAGAEEDEFGNSASEKRHL